MAKKKVKADPEPPKFEEAMAELDEIVRRLEAGGERLDQSLESYSKAIHLLKTCQQQLEQAERRVELLSGVDAQGNPLATEVESTGSSLEEKQAARSHRRSAPSSSQYGSSGVPSEEQNAKDELF